MISSTRSKPKKREAPGRPDLRPQDRQKIPPPQGRKLPPQPLPGPLNQLTAADTVTDAEDYIWATLTDPVPRPDAMAVLRAAYPNAMKLDYAPGGALDTGSDAIQQAAQLRTMSFDELFARFFEKMHGRTLTPEETAALAQLRQEAGL